MITDEQAREQYSKLKQIDKFAKELGITIYNIDVEFSLNDEIYTLSDMLNIPSAKYMEHKKFMEAHMGKI